MKCEMCGELLTEKDYLVCEDDKFLLLQDEKLRTTYILDYLPEYNRYVSDWMSDIAITKDENLSKITGYSLKYLHTLTRVQQLKLLTEILYVNQDLYHYIDYCLEERGRTWKTK